MNVKVADEVVVIGHEGRLGRPGLVGWVGHVVSVRSSVVDVRFVGLPGLVPMHSRNLKVREEER